MTTEHTVPIPRTREHWCGIELTPQYIRTRIEALENQRDEHTRRFIECYGPAHHQRVLKWFRSAL